MRIDLHLGLLQGDFSFSFFNLSFFSYSKVQAKAYRIISLQEVFFFVLPLEDPAFVQGSQSDLSTSQGPIFLSHLEQGPDLSSAKLTLQARHGLAVAPKIHACFRACSPLWNFAFFLFLPSEDFLSLLSPTYKKFKTILCIIFFCSKVRGFLWTSNQTYCLIVSFHMGIYIYLHPFQ